MTRQIAGIGKESRDTKTAVQTLNNKLDDITKELGRKPNTVTAYTVFGLILTLAVLIVSLYFSNHVPAVVESKLAPANERIGKMEAKLDMLLNGFLRQPIEGNPEQVKARLVTAKVILTEAEKNQVIFEPQIINGGGLEVVRYKPPAPEIALIAWETATQYLNYRSFWNQKRYPVPVPETRPARLCPSPREAFSPYSIPPW